VASATLLSNDRRILLAGSNAGPSRYRLFETLPMMPRFTIDQLSRRLGHQLSNRYFSGEYDRKDGHRYRADQAEKEPQLQLRGGHCSAR
jgi:hypothetical protein